MEIKWLVDFYSLCNAGSFALAAEERSVSPSAFGRRIRLLEEWVGQELIDRSQHPIRLTEAGECFEKKAKKILSLANDIKNEADSLLSIPEPDYRIAMAPNVSEAIALTYLRNINKDINLPNITLKVTCSEELDFFDLLNKNKIDIYIGVYLSDKKHTSSDIEVESTKLYQDVMVPVCRRELIPIKVKNNIEYAIDSIPYLSSCLKSPIEIEILDNVFKRYKEKPFPKKTFYISEVSKRKKMVLDGFGFSWLSIKDVTNDINSGRLIILGEESDKISTSVYSHILPGKNKNKININLLRNALIN